MFETQLNCWSSGSFITRRVLPLSVFRGLPQRHVKKIYVDSELRKKSACGGGNRVRMEGVFPESEGFRLNPDSHSLAGDLRQIT